MWFRFLYVSVTSSLTVSVERDLILCHGFVGIRDKIFHTFYGKYQSGIRVFQS